MYINRNTYIYLYLYIYIITQPLFKLNVLSAVLLLIASMRAWVSSVDIRSEGAKV